MWLNNLLLKIETGQELTENQERRLAKYLMLVPSIFRMFVYVVFLMTAVLLLYVGFTGGYDPLTPAFAYLGAVILIIMVILMATLPRILRIKKYLQTVEKFYETAFSGYDEFDLYYIDQHVSPHIRPLNTPKIYLLTDGYHFLFMSDPFKNTKYKLPKYLSTGKNSSYLRVINKEVDENSKIMVRLEDVEHFYISSNKIPAKDLEKPLKHSKYLNYFFDQSSRYDPKSIVVLKLKGGIILRLSHEVYPIFVNMMGHKEIVYEF